MRRWEVRLSRLWMIVQIDFLYFLFLQMTINSQGKAEVVQFQTPTNPSIAAASFDYHEKALDGCKKLKQMGVDRYVREEFNNK